MKDVTVVVGADGFMGSALLRGLNAHGRPTLAITRRRAHVLDSPAIQRALPGTAEYYAVMLEGATAVAWLASSTTPGSSAGAPVRELEGNLRPLLEFLKAWQHFPACRLLYVSTGGALYGDVAGGLADESSAVFTKSYYAAGKIAAEHFIAACCHQHGLSATILRPSNVYGHGQPYRPGFGIVPTAFHALTNGRPFTIWGDGGITRDYLEVEDFVSLCLAVLDAPASGSARIFNASRGEGTSIEDLLARIEAVTGTAITREHRPARAVDVTRIVLDNSAARAAFGWEPRVSLDEGLARAWQWFRSTQR